MRIIDKVESFLSQNYKLRDSDKALLLAYWEMQGLGLSDSQRAIFMAKCTPAESITRARRELRAKYPGSSEVEEVRYNKFKAYRGAKAVSWLED